MSKHSPGPWHLVGEGILRNADCEEIFNSTGISNDANARLIVAAPELLDALKVYYRELIGYDMANAPKSASEKARLSALNLAKKAIDKAEGKE